MKARWITLMMCCCFVAVTVQAQEKPFVTAEQLIAALDEATDIAELAVELRGRLPTDLPAPDFVREVAGLQRRCEPIIVLIAQTNPPPELQRLAMNIAMGVKGVELALWYYLYGVLSNQAGHINYGDQLLSRGRPELQLAHTNSTELR
jgi:hypothetical protein